MTDGGHFQHSRAESVLELLNGFRLRSCHAHENILQVVAQTIGKLCDSCHGKTEVSHHCTSVDWTIVVYLQGARDQRMRPAEPRKKPAPEEGLFCSVKRSC